MLFLFTARCSTGHEARVMCCPDWGIVVDGGGKVKNLFCRVLGLICVVCWASAWFLMMAGYVRLVDGDGSFLF